MSLDFNPVKEFCDDHYPKNRFIFTDGIIEPMAQILLRVEGDFL